MLEFKAWHHNIDPTAAPLELAKDVAAFANASGGTIVFGATEKDHRLEKYEGKDAHAAAALCDALHAVVNERLRPQPIVAPRPIEIDGTHVVALNVYPTVGQATGVRVKQTECDDGDHRKNVDAYLFPMRVGEDSIWLNPEQAAMLMIPSLRRTISMLRQVPEKAKVHVTFLPSNAVRFSGGVHTLESLDDLRNALVLGGIDILRTQGRVVPLDAVLGVHFDTYAEGADKGRWCIRIDSRLLD